jgi:hypothetical protein
MQPRRLRGGLAFFVAEPAALMPGLVQQAVVASISTTVAPMTWPVDGRDYSAADHQAHQRGADYGSGPMTHDGAHSSAHPRSPSLPLSRDLLGGRLVNRFGVTWLIRCAHRYLLLPCSRCPDRQSP